MATVQIDIDLDDIEDSDLIDEVERRFEHKRQGKNFKSRLYEQLGIANYNAIVDSVDPKNIIDELKVKWISEHFDKITLEELESIFK